MLVLVVVNQSIMGRPPLQCKLSTQTIHFRPTLRQSHANLTTEWSYYLGRLMM